MKTNILEVLMNSAKINEADANLVYEEYMKHKLIKMDGVSGNWSFSHGCAYESKTILGCLESLEVL